MRVLVIEDNPKMAAAIERGLREQGFAVDIAHSGIKGEQLAATDVHDVVILDVMLPDRDGVEVCRNLRRRGIKVKILMLTALGSTPDTIEGLDSGADSYLAKPFEFEELVARIRTLLRRGRASESRYLRYEDVEVDLDSRVAKRGGQSIDLSIKEFVLLEYFMRNPNRVLSRTQISEKAWDMSFESSSNVVDVYISSLRRKIDQGFDPPLIHTLKNAGYRFGIAGVD
jgi:DNA-binding response OmpR family regulator